MRSSRLLLTTLAFAAVVFLWVPGTAQAQGFPVGVHSTAFLMPIGSPPVSMFLVPNGSGTPLANCFAFGGIPTNVTILVTLVDAAGLRVTNYAAGGVRLEEMQTPLSWCANSWYPPPLHAPNLADGPSDAIGQSTFSLSYHGGGYVQGPTMVWVLEATGVWMPIPMPLNVSFNSPDINGDLIINLTDISFFATDYFGAVYMYRSDFNYDGIINLTDLSMLAQTLGVSCP